MKHTKCYRENYPRPQFVRNSFVSLDGEWEFAFGELGDERGKPRRDFPEKIVVPYSYHTKKSGIGLEKVCHAVWYRREISDPRTKRGERVLLHFDGCDHLAEVWLNGGLVGMHEGGYSRFTLDITSALKQKNELVVLCVDKPAIDQPRGKQRWTEKSVSCFYTETTGIWKSVWMETVSASYISSVSQDILFENDSIRYTFRIANPKRGQRVRVEAEFEGMLIAASSADVLSESAEIVLSLVNRNKILPVKFWSPGQPNLYDIKYTLYEGEKTIDEAGSYSALVRYDTCGGTFRLNYSPSVYLRSVLDQGYFPDGGLTAEEWELERDVKLIKEMGFNAVRGHEKIEDERFLYLCDVYGVILWLEMPSVYDFTEDSLDRFTREWMEIVRQYRNFPCIMAYVAFNESWGVMHLSENTRVQSFTRGIYHLTKALCPDRLVISNDGWDHTESDLVTFHTYTESGEGIREAYGDMKAYLSGGRTAGLSVRSPFAKGYSYEGQPVVVSECFGVTFEADKENGGWGYGSAAHDGKEFLARLESVLGGIRSLPECCGFCVTQIADVMQEKNGLLTETREPKVPVDRIREIILGK